MKSVVLPVPYHMRELNDCDIQIKVNDKKHLLCLRQCTWRSCGQESAVQQNTKKAARRTIYSLMGTELHGENGIAPDTSIHLLQTYAIPILVYGLVVVLPTGVHLNKLDKVHKNS